MLHKDYDWNRSVAKEKKVMREPQGVGAKMN
jgi:hypothetical protein